MKTKIIPLALLTSANAMASGFLLPEATYSNLGTAGAGDGVHTESATAMFTNPATMSGMGESLFTANITVFDLGMDYYSDNSFGPNTGDASASEVMPTIGLYYVKQVTESVHLGFALATQGGLSADYGNDWDAALVLNDVSVTTVQFHPSLSYAISDQWSVGVGAQFSYAQYEMNSSLLSLEEGDDFAFGYNLGVMYQASDELKLGLSYRSALEHNIDSHLKIGTKSTPVSVGLDIPAIVDFSAAYSVNSQWDLLASIQFHQWSAWDKTTIASQDGNGSIEIDRDWDDVWQFALGTEYKLNADWRLKAGVSYETSPQDDPTMQTADIPVGEQWRYSVGASTRYNDYLIDFYYQYTDLGSVEVDQTLYSGNFDGRLHFLGLSVSY